MKKDKIYSYIFIIVCVLVMVGISIYPFNESSKSNDEGLSNKEKNKLLIVKEAKKYNAAVIINNIDLANNYFKVQLQQDSLKGLQLVDRFYVNDVIEREKEYYVVGTSYRNFFRFELKLIHSQYLDLLKENEGTMPLYNFCVMNVESINFIMNCEEKSEERWAYGSMVKLID
jgi:hypothetical protein